MAEYTFALWASNNFEETNMKNQQQPSEFNERSVQRVEIGSAATGTTREQMQLDYLIETGFVWEEAVRLLHLRTHLYENAEVRQRQADDYRMQFARWLYEQGEITEL